MMIENSSLPRAWHLRSWTLHQVSLLKIWGKLVAPLKKCEGKVMMTCLCGMSHEILWKEETCRDKYWLTSFPIQIMLSHSHIFLSRQRLLVLPALAYARGQVARTRVSCSGHVKSARRKAFWKWCRRQTRSCLRRATRPLHRV